jgi:toxin ParE1/3/4
VKPVVPREEAERDVDAVADYYTSEAGEDVALSFVEALQAAYGTISERPGAGSPRFSEEFNVPGLRTRRLIRFPYLVFYIELSKTIDVWRVLHAQRDVGKALKEAEDQDRAEA